MRLLAHLTLILLLSKQSVSQDSPIIVSAGARIDQSIPAKDLYQYPEFIMGKVIFRDGRVIEAKMNYNRFTDEIFFIKANTDTLVLDNEETIKVISFERDSFYVNRGYILLVQSGNSIKLAAKQGFRFGDKRKSVSYDMTSSVSSVSNIISIEEAGARHRLVAKEQIVLYKTVQYYVGDKFDHFLPANQKNLAKLFPKCSSEIKKYCNSNKIEFDKRSELENLLVFIESTCR